MNTFRADDELLRRLIVEARDIFYYCDASGHFLYANPTAMRMMQYDEDEVVGRHFLELIRPDYRARAKEMYSRQFHERTPETYFEFPAVTKGGGTLWVGQHVQLVFDGDTVIGFQAIARDITRQKEAEERLRQSEARHRSLIEGATYGIFRTHADGRFLYVNPALASMLGYESTAELLAISAKAIYADPSVRDRLIKKCRETGRIDGVIVEGRRKDGEVMTMRFSLWLVRGDEGALDEFEVIAENVTERRRLEEQLRQAQKLEAVGQLAGGMAHNFNNLLTAILGYTELLLARFKSDASARADLEEVQKAGQRAAVLTQQLLAFSRQQVPTLKDIDLNETITGLERTLTRLIREDISLTCEGAPAPAIIRADPADLEQLVMNLVFNARDALPSGGHIHIEVLQVDLSQADLPTDQAVAPGAYVRLRVADDGTGIAPEIRAHLFEPFFTTKGPARGTGLGLASVYGTVRQGNGFILVDSEVGKGTTFSIYFPEIHAKTTPTAEPAPARPGGQARGETILLVEDEDTVRVVISAVLHAQGYRVFEAATPRAACKIFDERSDEIDLMLTDVVMPEMNGPALAQRFIGRRPDLPVLFVSGYADISVPLNLDNPKVAFLQKPFRPDELVRTVREILDRASQAV